MKRYRTEYFAGLPQGRKPVSTGYTDSLKGARRAIASRIVMGEYAFACVANTATSAVVSYLHRTKAGIGIMDDPQPGDDPLPELNSQTKVDEKKEKLMRKLGELGVELGELSRENRRKFGL